MYSNYKSAQLPPKLFVTRALGTGKCPGSRLYRYSLGENSRPFQQIRRLDRSQRRSGHCEREKNSCCCFRLNPVSSSTYRSHRTTYAIQALNTLTFAGSGGQYLIKTTMYEKLTRLLIDGYADEHHYCLVTTKIFCTYSLRNHS
jgi:hypothetical protein